MVFLVDGVIVSFENLCMLILVIVYKVKSTRQVFCSCM